MSDIRSITNQVCLVGILESTPIFSHSAFQENFYKSRVEIVRTNTITDFVPISISEKILNSIPCSIVQGMCVEVTGRLRIFTNKQTGRKELCVFASSFSIYPTESEIPPSKNFVFLTGCICRKPLYRKLSFGRHIGMLTVSVERNYGTADYVSCVALDRDALCASYLKIGTKVQISGLFQSRNDQYYEVLIENITEI